MLLCSSCGGSFIFLKKVCCCIFFLINFTLYLKGKVKNEGNTALY
ncbi:MAG: hypothetical protein KatS3mg033_0313 [Thermonema sp.]|nr:MAG: hypothetical protein KatS3mg033_0313 [Thermonema sp.]